MRFNKENLKSHIVKKMEQYEKKWKFDPRDGSRQVINSDIDRVIAYGEYNALEELWIDVEHNNIGEE
jgi:hypothetical protein